MEDEIAICIKRLSKVYALESGNINALNDVNIKIKYNEFIGIVGNSGSGKTTLLNMIGTLDAPTSGEIYILGKNVTRYNKMQQTMFRRNNIGFIFQDYNLVNELTVYENIILPLQMKKIPINQEFVNICINKLQLQSKMDKFPYQLSGGEQQRVAIIRALIKKPSIILADEPTGNLDSKNTLIVMDMLKDISNKMGITVILVTHNLELMKQCTRVVHIQDGRAYE